jgi:hypothetical protein
MDDALIDAPVLAIILRGYGIWQYPRRSQITTNIAFSCWTSKPPQQTGDDRQLNS